MDVKTAFLNGDLEEVIYMSQPEGYIEPGKENLVCKLKKSIYGLKQASRQWYRKFDSVISSFGFTENLVDECVYLKAVGNQFIFLILYVDDILLASSNIKLLKDTKSFLSKNFDMKDMREASYVLGIEIKRNRSQGIWDYLSKLTFQRFFRGLKFLSVVMGRFQYLKEINLTRISVLKLALRKGKWNLYHMLAW